MALETALLGSTGYSLGDLEHEWQTLDLARDAWLVVDDERVVGYGALYDRGELWRIDAHVHPDAFGRGAPAFHAAQQEAFADHWENQPRSFEQWRTFHLERPEFDPTLWSVVRAGEEIAAGAINVAGLYGGGWIAVLFTRRPWRRRGLGAALLAEAFGKFWARGEGSVGLSVDAESDTSAFRLYERAGMHAEMGWVMFEKEIDAGAA